MQTPTAYEALGGETAVRALVDRFYDIMDLDEYAKDIRAFHPQSLEESRQKLFEYFSYWLGGPQTYIESNGHPHARAAHAVLDW